MEQTRDQLLALERELLDEKKLINSAIDRCNAEFKIKLDELREKWFLVHQRHIDCNEAICAIEREKWPTNAS